MRPEERAPASVFSRVAVVHEWLTHPGGSEKVVLELLRMLPDAEVFTSVLDREQWADALRGRTVHASFLDRLPGARTHYPKLLPLMNAAFESFDFSGFDLVVSSSHSCAKNVITGPDTLHVCYCHTPMRHAWEPRFVDAEGLGPAGRVAAGVLMRRMRRVDALGATRPDVFVANSSHVAARIEKYYRRDARVIHPPVAVEALLERPRAPEDYYLVLGRAVGYKRVDLAVAACAMLGRRVKIAGTGRGLDAARAVAGPGAEFLGRVEDEEIGPLLSGARALLFPGEEDFGIVPVEAQAAGVPVVAYGTGGVRDSVIEGETGVFCAEQTPASLASAILEFEDSRFDENAIRENARRFTPDRFRAELSDVLLEQRALMESQVSEDETRASAPDNDSVGHALRVLRRRWPVLLAAVLALVAAAIAYRTLSTDRYEAAASVVFGAPSLSDAALQIDRGGADPERDAATNVLIAESPEVANAVREKLGTSESVSSLLNKISVAAEENANVLRVTAEELDPKGAARLANAFADQYIAFKARSEVQSIEAAENDLRRQLDALPADSAERASLQQSLERLAALGSVATGGARIIGAATPPSEPASIGLAPLLMLALILGLGVGLTAVFVMESTDRRVKSIEELEHEYGLAALAGIPQSAFRFSEAKDRGDHLEPYRILRSALEFSQVSRELDVLMVTSAVPGEGKTTVAVDMAQAIALSGRQVVLVELDLRRPTFGTHFGIDSRQGVTTALTHREPVSTLLQEPLPGLPNLLVLPSGRLPPNPSELLSSAALTELLEEVAATGAMVIVDAPPLLPVADAQILLNQTVIDASLIVARIGSTTRDEARRARAILDRHLMRPLGVVVTGLRDTERYGYSSYASEEPEPLPAAAPATPPAPRRTGNRR